MDIIMNGILDFCIFIVVAFIWAWLYKLFRG